MAEPQTYRAQFGSLTDYRSPDLRGGVGESGYGRGMGFEAMHDCTEAKSVWVNVDAVIPPHFKR
jgi:hypothetical protein